LAIGCPAIQFVIPGRVVEPVIQRPAITGDVGIGGVTEQAEGRAVERALVHDQEELDRVAAAGQVIVDFDAVGAVLEIEGRVEVIDAGVARLVVPRLARMPSDRAHAHPRHQGAVRLAILDLLRYRRAGRIERGVARGVGPGGAEGGQSEKGKRGQIFPGKNIHKI